MRPVVKGLVGSKIMGATGSKTVSSIKIPDIDNMTSSERPKAKEDLAASMNGQKIAFGFRKVDLDSQSEEILKSFAKGMGFLPEYAIQIEGHSNLAKSEKKLTAEDRARIQKLSEDRADACARFLKAANVNNEITCIGLGPLKGETKGCVRLVLSQKQMPLQAVQGSETENSHTLKKPDVMDGAVFETSTPDTGIVDQACIAPLQGTDAQFTIEVLQEKSSSEEGPKPSDAEETDLPSALESSTGTKPSTDPTDIDASDENVPKEDIDSKENEDPNKKVMSDETVLPEPPAPAGQWGNTYLPWYIACCSAKPQTEDCSLQGIPVKQMQLFH